MNTPSRGIYKGSTLETTPRSFRRKTDKQSGVSSEGGIVRNSTADGPANTQNKVSKSQKRFAQLKEPRKKGVRVVSSNFSRKPRNRQNEFMRIEFRIVGQGQGSKGEEVKQERGIGNFLRELK